MSPSYFGELVRERTVIASGDFHAACAGAVENQLPTVQLPRPHWQFTEIAPRLYGLRQQDGSDDAELSAR